MKKHALFQVLALLCLMPSTFLATEIGTITAGVNLQKTHKLYWENGFRADYTHEKLWAERLHFGFYYVSSRFGSAINSNALKQDSFVFSAATLFRKNKELHPTAKLNLGYFVADYEVDIFNDLPNSSLLLSIEGGLAYDLPIPLRLDASLGLNLLTGDGTKSPGTIYPLFYKLSASWII